MWNKRKMMKTLVYFETVPFPLPLQEALLNISLILTVRTNQAAVGKIRRSVGVPMTGFSWVFNSDWPSLNLQQFSIHGAGFLTPALVPMEVSNSGSCNSPYHPVCLSNFALWPHFSDRSKRSCCFLICSACYLMLVWEAFCRGHPGDLVPSPKASRATSPQMCHTWNYGLWSCKLNPWLQNPIGLSSQIRKGHGTPGMRWESLGYRVGSVAVNLSPVLSKAPRSGNPKHRRQQLPSSGNCVHFLFHNGGWPQSHGPFLPQQLPSWGIMARWGFSSPAEHRVWGLFMTIIQTDIPSPVSQLAWTGPATSSAHRTHSCVQPALHRCISMWCLLSLSVHLPCSSRFPLGNIFLSLIPAWGKIWSTFSMSIYVGPN